MSFIQEEFTTTSARELSALCLGELLGEGAFRRVHVWLPDPTLVAKFELKAGDFHNVFEYEAWRRAEGTAMARWLAPCAAISPCGVVLLQKRVQRAEHTGQLPKRVPEFFKDVKFSNWGLLDGKAVCSDYGLVDFWRGPKTQPGKLVPASW